VVNISYVSTTFKNNDCFISSSGFNRDNFLDFLINLKIVLAEAGFDLSTDDINPISNVNLTIHANIRDDYKKYLSHFNILIIFESEAIISNNFNLKIHEDFDVVFTWSKKLLKTNPEKYFYLNYSHDIKAEEIAVIVDDKPIQRNKKIMISANKKCDYPGELYSERERVINWYVDRQSKDFDLYGIRWDVLILQANPVTRFFNSLNIRYKFWSKHVPVYKGKAKSKFELYRKYKFAYCFENASGIKGYITEKIFDCIRCGIVPIYYGDDSISEYIPYDCYINFSEFDSLENLDSYLRDMTDDVYLGFQKEMKNFLLSAAFIPYTSDYFALEILNAVKKFNA
jgi:hypothetical protein